MKAGWMQFSEFARRDLHDLSLSHDFSLSDIIVAVTSLNGCQEPLLAKGVRGVQESWGWTPRQIIQTPTVPRGTEHL